MTRFKGDHCEEEAAGDLGSLVPIPCDYSARTGNAKSASQAALSHSWATELLLMHCPGSNQGVLRLFGVCLGLIPTLALPVPAGNSPSASPPAAWTGSPWLRPHWGQGTICDTQSVPRVCTGCTHLWQRVSALFMEYSVHNRTKPHVWGDEFQSAVF